MENIVCEDEVLDAEFFRLRFADLTPSEIVLFGE